MGMDKRESLAVYLQDQPGKVCLHHRPLMLKGVIMISILMTKLNSIQ